MLEEKRSERFMVGLALVFASALFVAGVFSAVQYEGAAGVKETALVVAITTFVLFFLLRARQR
jgi:ABC-type Mn2+/Zn2+ transport system permease subunit